MRRAGSSSPASSTTTVTSKTPAWSAICSRRFAASRSIADMVAKVRSVAAGVPKGDWVLMQAAASDFPGNVSERRWLNRQDLDQATDEHPVMVVLGIHASIMNTRAWKQTGYWEAGQDDNVKWKGDGTPRRGSIIHRDADGHPIGLATEVWDFRPGYSVEQVQDVDAPALQGLVPLEGVDDHRHAPGHGAERVPGACRSCRAKAACRSGCASIRSCPMRSGWTTSCGSAGAPVSATRCSASAA